MSPAPSVVCAVDLSHRSAKVLQHAGAIAEHFHARLIAATVARPAPLTSSALAALVRDAVPASETGALECQLRVASGPPAAAILRLVREEGADLLVIGTHGHGGYREGAFGSTTQAVLRHTDVPVLVVPNSVLALHSLDDRRELSNVGCVLAPIDFGPLARRDARIAAGIAETLGVPLLLVHVCAAGPGSEALDREYKLERLGDMRAEILGGTPIEILAVVGKPAAAVAAIAAQRNVGLVVMGLRGAGGGEGPRPGSIAYRLLCTTPTMVLALPPVLRRRAPDSSTRDRAVHAG